MRNNLSIGGILGTLQGYPTFPFDNNHGVRHFINIIYSTPV